MTQVDARKLVIKAVIQSIENDHPPYILASKLSNLHKKEIKDARQWFLDEMKLYIKQHP